MIVAFAFWYLAATGQLRPWNMFWLSLVNGIASGFQVPAWQSFVPSLVPREHLLAAVRLNSAQFTIARAVGPAFAGLVLRIWGVSTAFAANAVTFLLVIAVLLLVHPGQELAVGHNTVRDVLVDGARYVRARPPLLLAMGLAFVLSFCGQGLTQVSAGIAHDVFDQPTRASADLLTAFGFGTLSAGLVLVTLGTRVRTARLVAMSLLLYAAGIVALGATSRWPLGIAAFFVAGIGHVGSAVTLNAHVQSITEDVYRGRVVSFFLLGVVGGVPAGAVVLGRLGDRFGMRAVVIGDGLGFAVVVLLTMATGVFAVLNPISASTPATSPRTADQTGGPPSR
jgi:MFS family permease